MLLKVLAAARHRGGWLPAAALALTAAVIVGPGVAAQPPATYISGGTGVVRGVGASPVGGQSTTIVDEGGAVCEGTTGAGIGGGCIAAGPNNLIQVNDLLLGSRVAFQVCWDSDGDGTCTSPDDPTKPCPDQITFSHGDAPFGFANPLQAPQPPTGCPGPRVPPGVAPSWVVFLCDGVHNDPIVGPHTHAALTGTISAVGAGTTPSGNFCGGGPVVRSVKPYVILP